MAYTRTWDETVPAGSADADLIDDFIRNSKLDVRERVAALFGMSLAQFSADPIEPQGINLSNLVTAKYVGGSTDTKWRNNGDTSDLMTLSDAGDLTIIKDLSAIGGAVSSLDGWSQATIPASQAAAEVTRTNGRWIAPRAGSVLGIFIQAGAGTKCAAGTLTATVWKSVVGVGTSTHTDASLTLNTGLSTTDPVLHSATQAKDLSSFAANDELFVKFTTDSSWLPTTLTVRATLLVEF